MSRPVVAIVGRPNVGKSTLFNRLVGARRAIVDETPGITRDRLYGTFDWRGREFVVVDTGGILVDSDDPVHRQTRAQAELAMDEADLILFLTDAQEGLTPLDEQVADILRRSPKPVMLVANKVEGPFREQTAGEFYALGLGDVHAISAVQGYGVADLLDLVADSLPQAPPVEEREDVIRVAIVGRPNVGKSSLLNAILGEERVIVSSEPGTTRDAVDTEFSRGGTNFVLVDTAGIRRPGRVQGTVEYYTTLRAHRALERCDVALLVTDATQGIVDGDARVGGMAHDAGRGVVIVVNKWDLVKGVEMHRYAEAVRDALPFLSYAPISFCSARTGRGVASVLDTAVTVAENHALRIPTADLNRVIQDAVDAQPYSHRGRQLRIYYATMVKVKPPTVLLFVNNPDLVHVSYERYLVNCLREHFGFVGTPIRLVFRRREGKGHG
ncbi:MAG: ribosome biogenesis GTPase Der [Armatimonadota bacterium]